MKAFEFTKKDDYFKIDEKDLEFVKQEISKLGKINISDEELLNHLKYFIKNGNYPMYYIMHASIKVFAEYLEKIDV